MTATRLPAYVEDDEAAEYTPDGTLPAAVTPNYARLVDLAQNIASIAEMASNLARPVADDDADLIADVLERLDVGFCGALHLLARAILAETGGYSTL